MAFNPTGIFNVGYNPDTLNARSFASMVIRKFPAGAHPLFAMSSYFKPLAGGPVVNAAHGYHVKQFMFSSLKINNGAGYLASDTTIVVDSTAGVVAGMTFQTASREIIRVASVTNSTTLVITRAFGRVAAAALVDDEDLISTGNAHTEASNRPVARHSTATYVTNYTSIFRNAWGITNTAAASANDPKIKYNNLAETKEECVMYHTLDWENIALWSQPKAPATDAATGYLVHATQGVIDAVYQYASSNVHTALATTTLAQLETMLETSVSANNNLSTSTERVVLCNRKAMQVVNGIGRIETASKVQMDYGKTTFGTRYRKFESNFGTFTFVEDQVLNGTGVPVGLAIVIDPTVIGVGYLGGRDAITESIDGAKDGSSSGIDAKQGGLLTEMLIATHVPESCAVITNLTAAA